MFFQSSSFFGFINLANQRLTALPGEADALTRSQTAIKNSSLQSLSDNGSFTRASTSFLALLKSTLLIFSRSFCFSVFSVSASPDLRLPVCRILFSKCLKSTGMSFPSYHTKSYQSRPFTLPDHGRHNIACISPAKRHGSVQVFTEKGIG